MNWKHAMRAVRAVCAQRKRFLHSNTGALAELVSEFGWMCDLVVGWVCD